MLSRSPTLTKFNEQSLAIIIIGHNSTQPAPPSVTYFFLLASRTLYTLDFLPTSHWSLLHLLCCIFPIPCPLKDRVPGTQSLVFSIYTPHPPLTVSSSFKTLNNICMQMILMYISIPNLSLKYRLVFPTDYATALFRCLIGISKLIYKTKLTSLFSLPNLLHPWHSYLSSVRATGCSEQKPYSHPQFFLFFSLSYPTSNLSENLLTLPAEYIWNQISFYHLHHYYPDQSHYPLSPGLLKWTPN